MTKNVWCYVILNLSAVLIYFDKIYFCGRSRLIWQKECQASHDWKQQDCGGDRDDDEFPLDACSAATQAEYTIIIIHFSQYTFEYQMCNTHVSILANEKRYSIWFHVYTLHIRVSRVGGNGCCLSVDVTHTLSAFYSICSQYEILRLKWFFIYDWQNFCCGVIGLEKRNITYIQLFTRPYWFKI